MEYRASMGVPSGHFGFCPFGTLWLLAVGCWLAGDKLIYWEQSFGTFGDFSPGGIGLWPLASSLWPAWCKLIYWEQSCGSLGVSMLKILASGPWPLATGLLGTC